MIFVAYWGVGSPIHTSGQGENKVGLWAYFIFLYVSIQPSGANNLKGVENLKKCRHKMFLISTFCTYILSLGALGLLLGLFNFFGPYVQNAVKQYRKCKMYAPYAYTA